MIAHLVITGIVSIIPMKNGAYYLALAQDARAPHHPAHKLEPHYATILVEQAQVHTAAGLTIREQRDGLIAFDVNDWTIEVENASGTTAVKRESSYDSWVLPMKDAKAAQPDAKASHAQMKGARLPFTTGSLHATLVDGENSWTFSDSSKPGRPVADEICLTFPVSDQTLRLTFHDRKGEVASLELAAPQGEHIELKFQNVPEQDSIPESPGVVGDDHHVGLYFDLLPNGGPSHPPYLRRQRDTQTIPSLHDHRLSLHAIIPGVSEAEIRSTSVNCPPSDWEGDTTP